MANTLSAQNADVLRTAYLTLLKQSLTDTIHSLTCSMNGNDIVANPVITSHPRIVGEDWPAFAETMVGLKRLDVVQSCIEHVLADNVPGDFIETGVWRGGTCIFMRGVLWSYGIADRTVYVADSFEGLPPPDVANYPQDAAMSLHDNPYLAVSVDQVQENFSRYQLLDDRVKFIKGFFKDTLPTLRDCTWAVVRLDGDMYESTMDGLVNLYPRLSRGGYLLLDDYYHVPESAKAVDDFRKKYNIGEPIERVDGHSAMWRKNFPIAVTMRE